jgi:hypothetical protein
MSARISSCLASRETAWASSLSPAVVKRTPDPLRCRRAWPDQRFEALHLHAQGRLRPPDLQRRDADRARARDDGEVPEQCEVERRMPINLIDIRLKEYQFAQCNKPQLSIGHSQLSEVIHVA